MIQTKINNIYAEILSVSKECQSAVETYTTDKTDEHFAEIERLTSFSTTLWNDYQNAREELYDAENVE